MKVYFAEVVTPLGIALVRAGLEVIDAMAIKTDVILCPIAYVSEHIEILFDFDTEVKETCESLGIEFRRSDIVVTYPLNVAALVGLMHARMGSPKTQRQ